MANYVNAVRTGNLLYLAGKGPGLPGKPLPVGKVGPRLHRRAGLRHAARDRPQPDRGHEGRARRPRSVKRIVKVLGMVNAVPEFGQPARGDQRLLGLCRRGVRRPRPHARSAVGMGSLPRGIPVEIEVIVEVEDGAGVRARKSGAASRGGEGPRSRQRRREGMSEL
jgi:enamine deaminase RidA (YjgF/YER057c/UK114 family)